MEHPDKNEQLEQLLTSRSENQRSLSFPRAGVNTTCGDQATPSSHGCNSIEAQLDVAAHRTYRGYTLTSKKHLINQTSISTSFLRPVISFNVSFRTYLPAFVLGLSDTTSEHKSMDRTTQRSKAVTFGVAPGGSHPLSWSPRCNSCETDIPSVLSLRGSP